MPVQLITPPRFGDDRGWFSETYRRDRLAERGIHDEFVQDNHSLSRDLNVLRGLHFQTPPFAQAKLVRCISGVIWDVAVDVRKSSPTFGKWVAAELSAENGKQLYIPSGFAHGFLTLTENAEITYKVSNHYAPQSDAGLRWDDPALAIDWPLTGQAAPMLSPKDTQLPFLDVFDSPFEYDGIPLSTLDTDAPL